MYEIVVTAILLAFVGGMVWLGYWIVITRGAAGESSSRADRNAGSAGPGSDYIDSEEAIKARSAPLTM